MKIGRINVGIPVKVWGKILVPLKRLPVLVFAIVVEAQMGMFGFPRTTPCMFCGIRAMGCDM